MLRDALSGVNKSIRVGGHLIKTVSFADDQATLASSVKGLQLIMGKMQESVGEYDMKINVKKTKVKKICKRPGARFSKVPIINGPGKLSPFTLKIEVSIVLHLT